MPLFSNNGPISQSMVGLAPQWLQAGLRGSVRQGMDQNKIPHVAPVSTLDPLVIQTAPTTVTGNGGPPSGGNSTPNTTVSQVSGPAGSVLTGFSWARVSGDVRISATAPTSATTAFTAGLGEADGASGVWRCTATNNFGQTATADVTVNVTSGLETLVVSAGYDGGFVFPASTGGIISGQLGYGCTPNSPPFTQSWSGAPFGNSNDYDPDIYVPAGTPGDIIDYFISVSVTDSLGRSASSNSVHIQVHLS